MKRIAFLVVLFVFCVNFLTAQSGKWVDIKPGEEELLLEGTIWLDTESNESITFTYEFRAGGRLIMRSKSKSFDNTHIFTWGREGNIVRYMNDRGIWFYEGKYYPQTERIMVTGTNLQGKTEDTTMVPFQSSSVANTPAPPSSTTNVYDNLLHLHNQLKLLFQQHRHFKRVDMLGVIQVQI
jgi:hypothetical protein